MTERYICTLKPPDGWEQACEDAGSLFHSIAWQKALSRSLNVVPIYAWDKGNENGMAIPVFKVGPFCIGYVGFPVGSTIRGTQLDEEKILQLRKASFPESVHVLRLIVSPFGNGTKLPFEYETVWETVVQNLPQWQLSDLSKSARYDVRKAKRQGAQITEAVPSHHRRAFELYYQTIVRHQGNLRYTEEYFRQLLGLAQDSPHIRCLLAIADDKVIGFLVAILEGQIAYYLHGATDMSFKQYQPSDLLVYEAIRWAQSEGMSKFNMMASPLEQSGLVRYKEKWGGESKVQKTYSVPLQSVPAVLFTIANRAHNYWQKLAGLWSR
jgi:hypothetical protein